MAASEIIQSILAPLGGWVVVVTGLSVLLSKIYVGRVLQNERLKNEKILAEHVRRIEALERREALNYQQKIELYKSVSEPLAELVALIDAEGLTQEHLNEFNFKRLNITAQLALFASEEVFDSYNTLLEYIYDSFDSKTYSFSEFRNHALSLLSEMRKDIGIYKNPVTYKGRR